MNMLYIIAAAVLILLLLAFVVLLFSVIIFNMKAGLKYRQKLAHRLETLRLHRMLGALGIDTTTYLHSQKLVDVRNHMEQCATCRNTDTCDDNLDSDNVTTENIDYCNNEASLKKIVLDEMGSHKH